MSRILFLAHQIASLVPIEDGSANIVSERMVALLGNSVRQLLDIEERPEVYLTAYPMLREFKGGRRWSDLPNDDAASLHLSEIIEAAHRDKVASGWPGRH